MSNVDETLFTLRDETRELLEGYQYHENWIHHYTRLKYYHLILKQRQFRLTRCDLLEDPHEGDLIDSYIKKAIDSIPDIQKRSDMDESYSRFRKAHIEPNNVYVGSFCRTSESYLMWKAYGGNLTGGCISLKKKDPADKRIKLVRVLYDNRSKEQLVKKIIQSISESRFMGPDYEGIFSFVFESLRFIFKKKEYSGEREIRVIYYDNNGDDCYRFINLEDCFDIKGTIGPKSSHKSTGTYHGIAEHKSKIELRTRPPC